LDCVSYFLNQSSDQKERDEGPGEGKMDSNSQDTKGGGSLDSKSSGVTAKRRKRPKREGSEQGKEIIGGRQLNCPLSTIVKVRRPVLGNRKEGRPDFRVGRRRVTVREGVKKGTESNHKRKFVTSPIDEVRFRQNCSWEIGWQEGRLNSRKSGGKAKKERRDVAVLKKGVTRPNGGER